MGPMKEASNQVAPTAEIKYNLFRVQASLENPAHTSQAPLAGGTLPGCGWVCSHGSLGASVPHSCVSRVHRPLCHMLISTLSWKATPGQAALPPFLGSAPRAKMRKKFSVGTVLAPKWPPGLPGLSVGPTEDPHSFEMSSPRCVQ